MEIVKFKGRTTVDAGYSYCPYVPIMTLNPDNPNPSWQEMLQSLDIVLKNTTVSHKHVAAVMQERWPGPYEVKAWLDLSDNTFRWKLNFTDPHEAIIWRLKNSR